MSSNNTFTVKKCGSHSHWLFEGDERVAMISTRGEVDGGIATRIAGALNLSEAIRIGAIEVSAPEAPQLKLTTSDFAESDIDAWTEFARLAVEPMIGSGQSYSVIASVAADFADRMMDERAERLLAYNAPAADDEALS